MAGVALKNKFPWKTVLQLSVENENEK